jgi:exopolyphosphatase/guanosine-5'-triphosphate,3'-diphosphate pyrophosphatase
MFDIGGGSSELAWLDFRGGRPRGRAACRLDPLLAVAAGGRGLDRREVRRRRCDAGDVRGDGRLRRRHLRQFRGREKLRR